MASASVDKGSEPGPPGTSLRCGGPTYRPAASAAAAAGAAQAPGGESYESTCPGPGPGQQPEPECHSGPGLPGPQCHWHGERHRAQPDNFTVTCTT